MPRSLVVLGLCLVLAGCGEPAPGCDETGCDEGFYCNSESDSCEPDCTQLGCEGDLVCDPSTLGCLESCVGTGCADGSHCTEASGLCEPDCTEGSCGDGTLCNPATLGCEPAVVFDDPALEACVRADAGLPDGPIAPWAVSSVTHLECPDMGIESLVGLEHFVGLTDLTVWENEVVDLSPLEGLTALVHLQLGNNQISDVASLADLTALTALGLSDNQIADLSPLSGLTGLTWLNLDHNLIEDTSPIEGLTALTWLTLEGNDLTNITWVRELASDGVDVYSVRDRAAADALRRTPRAAGDPARRAADAVRRAPTIVHNFRTDSDGVVTFEVLVDDEPYEARHEFEGDILFDGSRFFYRQGGVEVPIGEVVEGDLFLCSGAYEHVCTFAFGERLPEGGDELAPDVPAEALEPVFTVSLTLEPPRMIFDPPADEDAPYGAYNGVLDPFVLASPNQFDAGSCLYMANTGAMEILLNQHTPLEDVTYEGDTDLSERYLMNASNHVGAGELPYDITDTLYTYNVFGGSLLNRDYRFTVGYVRDSGSGVVPADPDDEGAYASCQYNWFDDLPGGWQEQLTPTPEAERTLIALDPDLDRNSIWAVALMDGDVVARIKYELRTKRAPVVVVYNHYLYWHTNIIVGYDDTRSIGECPMVRDSMAYYNSHDAGGYTTQIQAAIDEQGGCYDSGIFYVRDSIYEGNPDDIQYSYSDVYRFREPYSQRIITHSYDWVRFLSNHIYTVHRE